MRREATALLGDDLVAELVPFSFPQKNGGEIKPAAHAYIPNLWNKISLNKMMTKREGTYTDN